MTVGTLFADSYSTAPHIQRKHENMRYPPDMLCESTGRARQQPWAASNGPRSVCVYPQLRASSTHTQNRNI